MSDSKKDYKVGESMMSKLLSELRKIEASLKISKILNAGSVDYDEYIKAHPKSKKQRNDPIFKSDKQENSVKGKHTDGDVIAHADKRLGEMKSNLTQNYGGAYLVEGTGDLSERANLEDARYAVTNSAREKKLEAAGVSMKHDDFDREKHISALKYLHHHGLHDSPTAKHLQGLVDKNKDKYKKVYKSISDKAQKAVDREENELVNFKGGHQNRFRHLTQNWTEKDQLNHYKGVLKAKENHDALGKKLGLA